MNLITLTAAQQQANGLSGLLPIIMMVLMFVILWFFMIRPQKKKQKEEAKMRDNIQPGDEIMTIGGFYGKVISVKEDTIVIESVVDKSKQKIIRTAVQAVLTVHDETDDK
ncbi:MAG: preprotein translocase subunit YajC [Ruminococcaceae bacterium]|nr:preprotein translocase subunit YajC [Oscillospiraceae bacterium]